MRTFSNVHNLCFTVIQQRKEKCKFEFIFSAEYSITLLNAPFFPLFYLSCGRFSSQKASTAAAKMLSLQPPCFKFYTPVSLPLKVECQIYNESTDDCLAFKATSPNIKIFRVEPSIGFLRPGESAFLTVHWLKRARGNSGDAVSNRF